MLLTYEEGYKEKRIGQLFCNDNNYSAVGPWREVFEAKLSCDYR